MNIKIFSLTLLAMVMLNGCYTRLGSFDQPGDSYIVEGADSLIDSTSPGARVDTIIHREKEICVWERDFTGMPRLRCFPSYYNSDWYFYNNSPWWFRTSSYWYDYKRCPRYYYFDPHCGCCRYYQHYPYRRSSGGGKGGIGDLVAVEAVEDQTVPVVSVAAVRSLRLREGLHYPRPPEAVLIKRVPIHHLSQIDLIEAEGLGHPV